MSKFSVRALMIGVFASALTFNMSNNVCGAEELASKPLEWVKVGDDKNSGFISVDGNKMRFHYFNNKPSSPKLACNIKGVTSSYLDVSAEFTPFSGYGKSYGIGYRMEKQNGGLKGSEGYYVELNKKKKSSDTPNKDKITLWYGVISVASKDVAIPDGASTLRITADGESHKIYLNGDLVIDVSEKNKTSPGYIGIFANYSVVSANLISVKTSGENAAISDNSVNADSKK